jgi:hypothetical protein
MERDAMRRWLMLMVAAVSLAGLVPSAQDQRYTADDFREKRDRLASLVGDGVAVLPPARSENFFFTGLDNREVALVLIPAAAAAKAPEPEMWKTTAYLPPKSPRAGVWDDRRVAMGDDIREATGIDNTAPAGRLMADIARVAAITDTL